MKTEQRTFDHPARVTSVARYSKAERNGFVAGDIILSFGAHSPTELIENPELVAQLKAGEWLLMVRGGVSFRLMIREGLEGCVYEATAPAENIILPSSGQWETYWGGIQTGGGMVLVPEFISWAWALVPPLLYARFRNWQMITAISLVWCIALVEGPITFVLSYVISVAVAIAGGSKMLIDASQKQGYSPRGSYGLASYASAAALEMQTVEALKPQQQKTKGTTFAGAVHAQANSE